MVAFKLFLFLLLALVALSYVGYAPARLLLRGSFCRLRLLFLPLLGLCSVMVLASFLNSTLFPMTVATWIVLAAASLVNVAMVIKTRSLGLPRPGRAEAGIAALMLLSYVIGVLPLVHANTTAFLGLQWDLELYLPLTEYLKRFAIGGELTAYPNPLIDALNSVPVRGGSGWGFSYAEAFVGTLLGWPSFETFRPMLQLVFSLSVPAVFLLCRWGLRMGAGASLLAAGLVGVNGLNLWIVSVGLAGHAVTLVTLPLALAATLAALRERTLQAALLAGLIVAAMLLSFYSGALPIYGSAVAGLGLVHLLRGPHRAEVVKTGLKVAAAVLAFGLVAHLRFLQVLPLYFRQGFTEGWHVPDFSPVSQALGLTPFALVTERLAQQGSASWFTADGIALLARGLSLAGGLLCLVALTRRDWDRSAFLVFLGAFGALALYLRMGPHYTYGYFKLLSLVSFLLLAGLAQGITGLWGWRTGLAGIAPSPDVPVPGDDGPRAPLGRRMLLRGAIAVAGSLSLLLLLANTTLSVQFFWEPDPAELPRSVWELHQLHSVLPAGAPVFVTSRASYDPRLAAVVSYFLIDNPMVGTLKTAYGSLASARPDQPYQYILLQQGERPQERGLRPQDLVWQNDLAALYRRPSNWLTAVELEGIQQPIPLASQEELAVKLTPDGWSLSNGREQFQGSYDGQSERQQVELSLLTFTESTAALRLGGTEERVKLPAGLISYRTESFETPATLQLSLRDTQSPAWLLGMRVVRPEGQASAVLGGQDLLLLQPHLRLPTLPGESSTGQVGVQDAQAELTLDYRFVDSRGGYATVSLEIYRRTSAAGGLQPAGYWQLLQGKGEADGTVHFLLDLGSWQCGTSQPAFQSSEARPPADGAYEAQLAVYYVNEELLRRPLLTFTMNAGRLTQLQQSSGSPYSVAYLPVLRDLRALERALPADAQVYVPSVTDPDRSFIPVTVASLKDRVFFTEDPALLPKAVAATPGAVYPYALLPSSEPPERWGYRDAKSLWANEDATLYRRTGESPLAHFGFLGDTAAATLKPGETFQALMRTRGVLLQRRDSVDWTSTLFPAPAERVQVRLTGIASENAVLTVASGQNTQKLEVTPGLFEYWTPSISAVEGAPVRVQSQGPGAVRLTAFDVYQPNEHPPGISLSAASAQVSAKATLVGDTAHVALQYFGPRPEDALIGVDIYSERPCELMHYGWWATRVAELPESSEVLLNLPRQQGWAQSASGDLLPTGSETWPIRGGTFRAFLLFKKGDAFETAPIFEFGLEEGRVVDFRAFPVAKEVALAP